MRILSATLLITLVGLASCSDKTSGFATPLSPDNTSQGNDPTFGNPGAGGSTGTVPAGDELPGGSAGSPVSGDPGGNHPSEPVPEPSTILLFGLGLTGLAVYRRRRRDIDHVESIA